MPFGGSSPAGRSGRNAHARCVSQCFKLRNPASSESCVVSYSKLSTPPRFRSWYFAFMTAGTSLAVTAPSSRMALRASRSVSAVVKPLKFWTSSSSAAGVHLDLAAAVAAAYSAAQRSTMARRSLGARQAQREARREAAELVRHLEPMSDQQQRDLGVVRRQRDVLEQPDVDRLVQERMKVEQRVDARFGNGANVAQALPRARRCAAAPRDRGRVAAGRP